MPEAEAMAAEDEAQDVAYAGEAAVSDSPWVGPGYTDEGYPYWYNQLTGESSWIDPHAPPAAAEGAEAEAFSGEVDASAAAEATPGLDDAAAAAAQEPAEGSEGSRIHRTTTELLLSAEGGASWEDADDVPPPPSSTSIPGMEAALSQALRKTRSSPWLLVDLTRAMGRPAQREQRTPRMREVRHAAGINARTSATITKEMRGQASHAERCRGAGDVFFGRSTLTRFGSSLCVCRWPPTGQRPHSAVSGQLMALRCPGA